MAVPILLFRHSGSLAPSTGPSGNPTGTKAAGEARAGKFGDACLDLVANSLTVAVRRGRIDANFRRAALTDLALLDIITDDDTDVHAWGETLNMANRFQLTVY